VLLLDWKEQQKIIEDVQQTFLNPDLSITKNNFKFAKEQNNIKYDTIVLCPFCLTSYELNRFNNKKGLRICPNCDSKLKLSTLSEINDLDKFVNFVFNYRLSGFWDKICLDILQQNRDSRFNEWNKRLHDLGLSYAFWEKYKNLKGDIVYEE